MSGLDIDALRLTDDEVKGLHRNAATRRICADAQLAKALWDIVDWLHAESGNYEMDTFACCQKLLKGLEQANIERPSSQAAAS